MMFRYELMERNAIQTSCTVTDENMQVTYRYPMTQNVDLSITQNSKRNTKDQELSGLISREIIQERAIFSPTGKSSSR